jgi:hypothetical protein
MAVRRFPTRQQTLRTVLVQRLGQVILIFLVSSSPLVTVHQESLSGNSLMTVELSSTQTIAEMATLGKMLHEHRPALLAMLERRIDPRLGNRLHAEDLLSEAFLEARRKLSWFKQQTGWSPYLWLYRICMDCLIAAWRRESRDKRDVRREMPLPEQSSICMGLGLVQSETSPSHGVAR